MNQIISTEIQGERELWPGGETKRMARPWSDYMEHTLGGLLCLAAVLKGVNAYNSPGVGYETVLAVLGTGVEFVVGVALVLRFRPSITLPAAGFLFVLMAGASWIGTIREIVTGLSLGPAPVPPWVVLVFDALAAAALPWALRTSGTLRQKQTVTLLASCVVTFFIGIVAASAIHPKYKAVTSDLSPEAIAAARMVMFEPRNLKSDRPFPLLPYIRINADLTQGEWKIIFAKWDCSTCERFLRGGNCKPNGQERVAVVLVIDKEDWTLYQECKAVLGGLSPKKIWRIQTPTTLRLKDGRFQMMN